MNDVETQADKVQWADDEVDLPSDCYSSSADDSDAEVPDVTEPLASTSNGFQGTEDQSRGLNLSSASGNNSVASTSRQSNKKEIDLGQGWKPVIGGKLQGVEERASMQAASSGPTSLSPSSKQQTSSEKSPPLPSSASDKPKKDGNESDSDVRRVPEMSAKGAVSGAGSSHAHAHAHAHEKGASGPSSRKRGGASADKEHKRLKRLLRNRVSAQQARERKKAYLTDLEIRSKDLERRTAELEERVSTLQRENHMLRQIVKNTALKKTGPGGSPAVGPQV